MSQELIAIIGAVIGLAAPGERVGKVESTLGGRIARHEVPSVPTWVRHLLER